MAQSGKFPTEELQNSFKNVILFASFLMSVTSVFFAISTRHSLVELQQNLRANEIQTESILKEFAVMKTKMDGLKEAEGKGIIIPGRKIKDSFYLANISKFYNMKDSSVVKTKTFCSFKNGCHIICP